MNVVLALRRQLKVDNQTDLLDIDAARQQVARDENTACAGAERINTGAALLRVHIAMDIGDLEVVLLEALRKPLHLGALVTIDDSRVDVDVLVEIAKTVELPCLLLHLHVVLANTLQCHLLRREQDADRVLEHAIREFDHLIRHCC